MRIAPGQYSHPYAYNLLRMTNCTPDTPVEIRHADLSDLEPILELLAQDFLGSRREQLENRESYLRAFDEIAADHNNELIVATVQAEVVGTFQVTFIPGLSYQGAWRAQIEAVRVRADVRNLRIGTRMIHWAIARAKERNCRIVQLTTNIARVDAQRFYKRLGFEQSHVGMKLILK
jgi:GNAT superfamily N-acetyltransferase